jgi:Nucleoside-diphosphate-sugar epimerases
MHAPESISSAIITGGTGPIGFKLVQRLVSHGCKVLLITSPTSARHQIFAGYDKVEIVPAGLEGLRNLDLGQPWDVFFHLGWIASENRARRDDPKLQADNIGYALDAVACAARSGCKVFVGAGSQAEYGRLETPARPDSPTNPTEAYGIAKLAAGRLSAVLCRQLGMRHCWARIHSVFGEHDRQTTLIMYVIGCLLRGESPRLTACEQQWDYLYSGECAEALWRLALTGADGMAYPLGSGEKRSLKEYLQEVRSALGVETPLDFGALPYPPGQVMHMQADIAQLAEDTGWKPKNDFSANIRHVAEAQRG